MDHVVAGKFKLGRKIGSGSFGELYLGIGFLLFNATISCPCWRYLLIIIWFDCFQELIYRQEKK